MPGNHIVMTMTPEDIKKREMAFVNTMQDHHVILDKNHKIIDKLEAEIKSRKNECDMLHFLLDLPLQKDAIAFMEKYTGITYSNAKIARDAAVKASDTLVAKIPEYESILAKRKSDQIADKRAARVNKRQRMALHGIGE